MVKKATQINELELVDFYEKNNISVRKLANMFGINSTKCANILKAHGCRKYAIQSAKHGHKTPWNKGQTKSTNPIIRSSIKKQSESRRSHYTKDGYPLMFCDELGKSIKVHDYVWYSNTGHWPNSKNNEQIHHIDGDKNNNAFDNLLLVDIAEHSRIHKEYEEVFIVLYKTGLISFSKETRSIDWKIFSQVLEKLSKLN